jgi:luciferase family oxidoreductase group 1
LRLLAQAGNVRAPDGVDAIVRLSVLDLVPVRTDQSTADALAATVALAQTADRLGFTRYWLAEHHNMPGIASAATSIVIGHVAAGTKTIRVGSGGIMLPNHSPLVIAEQFGTLAALFPGRIELGLGRAPGTDQATVRALRRDPVAAADRFPDDVLELQHYFEEPEPGQKVRAVPGMGLKVPIWLLGSSLFSAQLAAKMGLPFAFASHFAPAEMMGAVHLYRATFRPSKELEKPYLMLGINVICAATDGEARRQFTSVQQSFTNLRRGTPGQIPPPIDDIETYWSPAEKAMASHMLVVSAVGSPETVQRGLQNFVDVMQPDELIMTAHLYDHRARLESFERVAALRDRITVAVADAKAVTARS